MFDSQDDEELNINDAIQQMLEYQRQVDDVARRTVESVKRMIATREMLEPGCSKPFARTHGAWYDAVEQALVDADFRASGPWQDRNSAQVPDERRSFYRFALSADGTIVASWFMVPAEKPFGCVVLESWFEDGSKCVTGVGLLDSGIPTPPWLHVTMLPGGAHVGDAVDAQRRAVARQGMPPRAVADIDEALGIRHADADRIAEFRTALGLGLFEPMIRKTNGDDYEDLGAPIVESILQHPEWWAGEDTESAEDHRSSGDPSDDRPLRLMFLMSRDEASGRVHITTLGMVFQGLPEMQMKELAANHCRAARFLMMATGRRLLAHTASLSPDTSLEHELRELVLEVDPSDVRGTPEPGLQPPDGVAPVNVRLVLEGFEGANGDGARGAGEDDGDDETRLLRLVPPAGQPAGADLWLTETCRRLGLNAPPALPASAYDEAMAAASRVAVRDLESLRRRLTDGAMNGDVLMVKTGLPTASGGKEFVWVRVTDAPAGAFVGTLDVDPQDLPGLEKGQTMRVADGDVFDRAIFNHDAGVVEAPLTDLIAQDFGVDLPG